MTSVLLSIKPRFVEAMIRNEKHYEFRKSRFAREPVETVYIYTTAPVKKITASFEVGGITRASPIDLWRMFGGSSGLERDELIDYFSNQEYGYAIGIKNFRELDSPVDPHQIMPRFTPPQSYQYMTADSIGKVETWGKSECARCFKEAVYNSALISR